LTGCQDEKKVCMKRLKQLGPGLNAFTLSFADSLLDEMRDSYQRELHPALTDPRNRHLLEGGHSVRQPLGPPGSEYFMVSFMTYPLLWFSSNTMETYRIYRRFYDNLGIDDEVRQLVDHDEKIVMYCGFLVIGDRSNEPSWHFDYVPGANGYSLLTPLFEFDPGHGDLLYRTAGDTVETYMYEMGEAVMFGDHFFHCTQPYDSTGHLRVLATIQFGTDKMQYWETLRKTIESQSDFLILPCGHQAGTCGCAVSAPVQPHRTV
jgi:hypothetical protein